MSSTRRMLAGMLTLHLTATDSALLATSSPLPGDCNGNGIPDATDISAGTSEDCYAIGLPDEVKGEVIALYLVPAPGVEPDQSLTARVIEATDKTLGKAFRPQAVRWVDDLPRTRSQKIMRRVVKAVALGNEPGDLTSLENPESLSALAD